MNNDNDYDYRGTCTGVNLSPWLGEDVAGGLGDGNPQRDFGAEP